MANLIANTAVDMTEWDFANIKNGAITGFTPTKYSVKGQDGLSFYQFTGVNLTYNGAHLMTGGTVTAFKIFDSLGNTTLSITGFSMGAAAVESAIQSNDAGGAFENFVFAHPNTITGSDFDDVLLGLADGKDTIYGGKGDDQIVNLTTASNVTDAMYGGDGDDTIYVGAQWLGAFVSGGAGYDTMVLDGNYPLTYTVNSQSVVGIEQLLILGGPSFSAQFGNTTIAAGETLLIDASQLGAAAKIMVDGRAELDGHFDMIGSAGADRFRGGDQDDSFSLTAGGRDRAHGGAGGDQFNFGASFTAADRVDGGTGDFDVVLLDGDYSAGITFGSQTVRNIDRIELAGGHSYKFIVNDGNIGVGERLGFVGASLGAGDTLYVDASDDADGGLIAVDGAGDDTIIGGGGEDTIALTSGGHNIVKTLGGDDAVQYGTTFDAAETIDAGAGNDEIVFSGEYGTVTFTATTIINVETMVFTSFADYAFVLDDATVAAGQTLTLDAGAIDSALYSLTVDGSAELDGKFVFLGGDANDTLTGGAKGDFFRAGLGGDFLAGGLGQDSFGYTIVDESTGRQFDTIDGLNGNQDVFDVPVAPAARDTNVITGALDRPTFNADLEDAIQAGQLGANNFVIFRPDAGSFAGSTFLIVDSNGVAGYQANLDLVIRLTNDTHLLGLTAGDFA